MANRYDSDSSDSDLDSSDVFFATMAEVVGNEEYQHIAANENKVKLTRARAKNRDREEAHNRLYQDYFADDCVFSVKDFRRRFRMCKETFLRISNDLEANYEYFQLKTDARGKRGFTGLQKCAAAVQLMAGGYAADVVDQYMRMSSRTARESMYLFCEYIFELYGHIYLRKPTRSDVEELYAAHHAEHGLPGMLGSIDCTHWDWELCPYAWKGHYTSGFHKKPSLILEAVASYDLWIWHAFFGVPGSNNDVNVLDNSPIFDDIYQGKAADVPFEVNGTVYPRGYLLTDGIYPRLSNFVKAYQYANDDKRKLFTKRQESARKDVERTFGVLKKKWHIVSNPSRAWYLENIRKVMYWCIILHNMIVEEKGRAICTYQPDQIENLPTLYLPGTSAYLERVVEIHTEEASEALRHDLTEYVYDNANDETDDEN